MLCAQGNEPLQGLGRDRPDRALVAAFLAHERLGPAFAHCREHAVEGRTAEVSRRTLIQMELALRELRHLAQARGAVRPLPYPETGRPIEFLLMRHGTRVSIALIRNTLRRAVGIAGLVDAKGRPRHITPHQFRHTYATALINAGISLPALMRLLGHVSATMSLRYGHLFDATVRQQYEAALSEAKSQYSTAMLEVAVATAEGEPDANWMRAASSRRGSPTATACANSPSRPARSRTSASGVRRSCHCRRRKKRSAANWKTSSC